MAETTAGGVNAGPERGALRASDGAQAQVPAAACDGQQAAPAMTVLYDGACPLCRREIGVYRGLTARQPLAFEDVSAADAALPEGKTRAALLARFHVRLADGSVVSGAHAFLALWAVLPGWRWLARAGRLPGMAWLMERAYRFFLRLRPVLQRWAVKLDGVQAGR